jgi:hypothetical protein
MNGMNFFFSLKGVIDPYPKIVLFGSEIINSNPQQCTILDKMPKEKR